MHESTGQRGVQNDFDPSLSSATLQTAINYSFGRTYSWISMKSVAIARIIKAKTKSEADSSSCKAY